MSSTDEKRIMKVFGKTEVPEVSEENLLLYRQYLLAGLDKKTILVGREDFPWEERYLFGGWSQKEYENLKRTNLSYTDECELVDILEEEIEDNDLVARVRRLSDDKHLYVGLSWLTTKNRAGKDYQLLDDFATWAANW